MKRLAAFLAAAVTGLALSQSGVAVAQTSYPLICRGGGAMVATVFANGSIRLNFTAGATAGGTSPPTPGQCTWLDRGFRPGEPHIMQLSGNPAGSRYLLDGMLGGGNFFAHVYNNGAGTMIVTRIGP